MGEDTALRFGDGHGPTARQQPARTAGAGGGLLRNAELRHEGRVLIGHGPPIAAWAFFVRQKAGGVIATGNPGAPTGDLALPSASTCRRWWSAAVHAGGDGAARGAAHVTVAEGSVRRARRGGRRVTRGRGRVR